MQLMLMTVTIAALVLGAGMSLLAWKLLADEGRRSAARVAALAALAAEAADDDPFMREHRPQPVVGAGFSRPSGARRPDIQVRGSHERPIVGARSADLRVGATPSSASPGRGVAARFSALDDDPVGATVIAEPAMFVATEERGAPGRRWLALVAVVAVMAVAGGGAYLVAAQGNLIAQFRTRLSPGAAPAADAPLELLSLRDSLAPDGTFTVTGLVQNPANGGVRQGVVATLLLFDPTGEYIADGRAPLEMAALQPGEQSPFVITVPNGSGVTRYRVGFRTASGAVVAHVDRRGQAAAGPEVGHGS